MTLRSRLGQFVRSSRTGCIAVTAAILIGVSAPTAASATTLDPVPTSADTALKSAGSALTPAREAELTALDGALNEDAKSFNVDLALDAGASAAGAADFAHMLSVAGWHIEGSSQLISPSALAQELSIGVTACTGLNGYTGFYGAFWQFALNSCQTDLLIAAVAAGGAGSAAIGGIIAALGAVPVGAVTAAVGGLIAAGAPVLNVCKTASYGVHAIYINAFVGGGIGCWGQ